MSSSRTTGILAWHVDAAGAALCASLAAVAFFGVIRPIMNRQSEARALEREIADAQIRADAMQQTVGRVRTLLAEANVSLASSDLTLQSAEQLNRRIADIVALAGECGMVIAATRTAETERLASHSTIPVGLTGNGSYGACATFLNALAERLPDVKVLAFELSGKGQSGSGNDAFSFDLAWYAAPSVVTADAPIE